MSNLAFDTYSFVKDLTKTGMKTEQAEVLARTYADLLTDRLATKDDIALLKKDIAGVQKDIAGVEDRLNSRIDGVEDRLNSRIDGVQKDIEGVKKDIEGVEDRLNSRIDGVQKDITASEQRLGLQIAKTQVQTIVAIVGVLGLLIVLLQFFGPVAG